MSSVVAEEAEGEVSSVEVEEAMVEVSSAVEGEAMVEDTAADRLVEEAETAAGRLAVAVTTVAAAISQKSQSRTRIFPLFHTVRCSCKLSRPRQSRGKSRCRIGSKYHRRRSP